MATDHLGGVVAGWAILHFTDWRCRNPGLAERFEAAGWRLHRQPDAVTIIEGHETARTVSDNIAYSRLGTDSAVIYITRNETRWLPTPFDASILPIAGGQREDESRDAFAARVLNRPFRSDDTVTGTATVRVEGAAHTKHALRGGIDIEADPLQAAADQARAAHIAAVNAINAAIDLGITLNIGGEIWDDSHRPCIGVIRIMKIEREF